MIVKVLASGSKGNCTYLEVDSKKFLIDCGISYLKIKKELENIDIDINSIDYLLITHSHKDHINGLSTILKKTNITVLIHQDVLNDLNNYTFNNLKVVDDVIDINATSIKFVKISHDVSAFGFLITNNESSLVYITDTGYINRKYINLLKNKTMYIIESNHNEKMLMEGPYPYILKQRVLSDKGHLSNSYTGRFLSQVIGNKTKYIVLAHISQHNNTYDLAYDEVLEELKDCNLENIIIFKAFQEVALDCLEV